VRGKRDAEGDKARGRGVEREKKTPCFFAPSLPHLLTHSEDQEKV